MEEERKRDGPSHHLGTDVDGGKSAPARARTLDPAKVAAARPVDNILLLLLLLFLRVHIIYLATSEDQFAWVLILFWVFQEKKVLLRESRTLLCLPAFPLLKLHVKKPMMREMPVRAAGAAALRLWPFYFFVQYIKK